MKRVRHIVIDLHRTVRAEQVLPEGEVFEPPPWVRHKVLSEGWSIRTEEFGEPGINDHGHVNWYEVATRLADTLRELLDAAPELDEASAMEALSLYDIALAEMALEMVAPEPEEETDD